MNKAPQPIAAPPSIPHPAPSPGLPQASFPPGQPPSVVFATPPLQMNTAPQPRQFAAGPRALNQQGGFRSLQPYYQNRPGLPGPAPRQPSSAPRPVAPTHVYQPGAQMMMISQQQLPFANTQSTAYFIPPGQYRSTYVATAPQYSMPTGTPGFYTGTSPAEYEPPLAPGGRGAGARGSGRENSRHGLHGAPLGTQRFPAGAYYPAQPQYPPSVPPTPVIINPPQPQPAPPPQPPVQTKRERKQIRIRDPNQGGRDITEEIMSGGRSASTPTPPQCAVAGSEGGSPIQANGECAPPAVTTARPDDGEDFTAPIAAALTPPCSMTPEPAPAKPPADQSGPVRDGSVSTQGEGPVPLGEAPDDAPRASPALPSLNSASDHVDVPTPPPAPTPPSATSAPTGKQPVNITTEELTAPETEERVQQVKGGDEEGEAVSEEETEQEEAAPAVIEADLAPVTSIAPVALGPTDPPSGAANGTGAEDEEDRPAPKPEGLPEPPSVLPQEPQLLPNGLDHPEGEPDPVPESAETQDAPVVMPTPDITEATAPHLPAEEPDYTEPEISSPSEDTSVQASEPMETGRKMEDLDHKEVMGDLEACKEKQVVASPPESEQAQADLPEPWPATPVDDPRPATPADEPHPATPADEPPPATPADEPPPATPADDPRPATPVDVPRPATPVDDPRPATPVDDPRPATPVDDPRPATPVDDPRPATPIDEPRPATPADEPRPATPADEPRPATPADEPRPATPADEPRPATPADEPRPATPADEPRPATPVDEPRPATPVKELHPTMPVEEPEEEEKQDAVSLEPEPISPGDLKYQYKGEQWKPIDPEEKKRYDREFLLGFQFMGVSMHKPEGLPPISDVVLDKANKTPLRPLDPSRMTSMICGPDFTPSFANLGRPSTGGRGPPSGMGGPRRSQQGQRKEPRKIIASVSLSEDVQLNKAEKAWKPAAKKAARAVAAVDEEAGSDEAQTQELFRRVRSILNKLTPQMFQPLMKQVTELTIDTEERLKGVIDLIFEKAISEPNFSVAYANMCRCLMGLKVPTTDKPTVTVNFRKLLLNRCQKEFEKDKDNDEIFEKKQKDIDAATVEEERQRLKDELEDFRDKARRRSLGNIKFIGELFKLKMLTEAIMHDCVVKLLKNHDEESVECLCRLLSTIGKDLDFQKAKPRMDQYFTQMEKIIKERKTSSRIRFMLQDVLDVRRNNWVPRRGDQGPKTIDQIHKEAELEEHREQAKVQQQLLTKKDTHPRGGGGGGGGRGGPHPGGGRGSQPQDEGWNTVPISTKNRPIDTSRLSKITKPGALDFNNPLLVPGGKVTWGSWGKGSSGGSGSKPSGEPAPESGRPATSTLNRFSALQQTPSSAPLSRPAESDRRVPQRNSSSRDRAEHGDRSDRFDRPERREERGSDRQRLPVTKRSFSRETERRGPANTLRTVSSMTDDRDRGSRDRGSQDRGSRDRGSRDRANRDRANLDRGSRDRANLDRGSRDRANLDRGSRDRANLDRGSRDRANLDRGSRDRADLDRGSRDRANLDRTSRDRANLDQGSGDRANLDRGSRDRGSRDRVNSREMVQRETDSMPPPMAPPPFAPAKPAMSEDELEKKSKAILEEYLHINDMKEALQCVLEMNAGQLLFVFVRNGIESTLERSAIAREHMGLLLHQLVKAGTLSAQQYYQGLQEILEVAEDMAIDIPHIWLYLAEIIVPMLHEGGIPMGQLFRELSKPLLPLGKAAVLLAEILVLLCKGMSQKKAGALWREAGLSWRDYLLEEQDVNIFVTEKKVEFTLGDDSEKPSSKELSSEELCQHLDKLIQQKADNQRIYDWVEANLDEQQAASNLLARALMTSVCQSAIIGENPYKVDAEQITLRAKVLQKYLTDEQKELQALYALQALMVKMEQPANLLRMFFDTLYDEDVIKEEAFYKWESSKDPAEQQGKGVALKSVTAFFTWLREAEEESDNS